jgi:hypothetical protein
MPADTSRRIPYLTFWHDLCYYGPASCFTFGQHTHTGYPNELRCCLQRWVTPCFIDRESQYERERQEKGKRRIGKKAGKAARS